MLDDYQLPALVLLTCLLLPFFYLHYRFRNVRTRLWLLGMLCVELHAYLSWRVTRGQTQVLDWSHWALAGGLSAASMWMLTASEVAGVVSASLFLASLSPLGFTLGRRRVMYVVPYSAALVVYATIYYSGHQHPGTAMLGVYCALTAVAVAFGLAWCSDEGPLPVWLSLSVALVAVALCVPPFLKGDVYLPMMIAQAVNQTMTALLVVYTFRRLSPGVLLAAGGFMAGQLLHLLAAEGIATPGISALRLARMLVLARVLVAAGLILLVMEDEIASNAAANRRERRVRMELEAYARELLTARSLAEFDDESARLCEAIALNSRFSRVALMARRPRGSLLLIGSSGMDGATVAALDALAQRMDADSIPLGGERLVAGSATLDLDLDPWLEPGDELQRLRLTRVAALPILGPERNVEGLLMLTGLREPQEPLRADDLLALESLAVRLQAARSQALLVGKLIESEQFAGIGQLATSVAMQLNNPLTVILGYGGLLHESELAEGDHHATQAIVAEARRMKKLIERISGFSRHGAEHVTSFSAAELVADIEQLHRVDFLRYGIDFRVSLSPELPGMVGHVHQIRQALMHATRFAIASVQHLPGEQAREVRLEVTAGLGTLQMLVGHSGRRFAAPEHAFDSLATGVVGIDAASIGLSLSAAILHAQKGRLHAVNLEPRGAAVILEVPLR